MLGPESADQEEGLLKAHQKGKGQMRKGWGEGRQKDSTPEKGE